MLHVHEDDPDRRRLVLRAPAPGLGDVGRRVLASVLAVAPVLIALAWTWMSEPRWHSAWLVPVGLGVAAWITGRFATEVTELGFDGGAGQAWVEERGHRIWGTRRRAQPLTPGDGLAFRGGALTGQPHQLGVVMELAGRAFTPAFVVEGVERRAELVDLVERLAGRIGREVLPQRDDVDVLRLYCGAEGAPSPTHRGAARSYRDGAPEAPLELHRGAGFEAPSVLPPPLPLGEIRALVDGLEVTGTGELTLTHARPPFLSGKWLLGGGYLLMVLGATLLSADVPLGEARWAEALVFFGVVAFVLGIRSYGVVVAEDCWRALGRALRPVFGPPRMSPPTWGAHVVRRATLRPQRLDLELRVGSLQLTGAELVLLQRERRRGAKSSPDQEGLALWVVQQGRWYRLATAPTGDLEGPGAATLRRVAFEVAAALDAPLRAG